MGTKEPARGHFPLHLCCFIVPLNQRHIRGDKSGTLANKHAGTRTKYDTKTEEQHLITRVISSRDAHTASLLDLQTLYEEFRFTDDPKQLAMTPKHLSTP